MNKVQKEIQNAKKENLNALYLEELGLSELPIEIRELKDLTSLHLEDNQLSSLPNWIGELENLEKLYLDNNKISVLPEELGNLKKLTFFHFRNNKLSKLPSSMVDIVRNILIKQQRKENQAGIKYIGVDGNSFMLTDLNTFEVDVNTIITILFPGKEINENGPLLSKVDKSDSEFVIIPLTNILPTFANLFSATRASVGGYICRIDLEFNDGTKLRGVKVFNETDIEMPTHLAHKPIKLVSIPFNQNN